MQVVQEQEQNAGGAGFPETPARSHPRAGGAAMTLRELPEGSSSPSRRRSRTGR
jgi:hypothetical protein